MLSIENLTKKFGGLVAVDNVSFTVKKGEIHGLIGPNGSGKTTILNMLSGVYGISNGSISLEGERIENLKPSKIANRGVARTFQITKIFRNMSVLENMLVPGLATGSFENFEAAKQRALELLDMVKLQHLIDEFAKNLSGGQQKLLEFVRALMMNPHLFLMDEPFVGVNPVIKTRLTKTIKTMNENGVTFLIVSHDIPSIMDICSIITVLAGGKLIAEGNCEDIKCNEKVVDAYLGC